MRFLLSLLSIVVAFTALVMASDLPKLEGLQIVRLQEGKGDRTVERGDDIEVHYIGTLTDGKEFDQSHKRGKPLAFKAGAGQVIKGWDEGLIGMKVGEKRKLTIAPDLAYGDRGAAGVIPPKATLIFETELMKIGGRGHDEL